MTREGREPRRETDEAVLGETSLDLHLQKYHSCGLERRPVQMCVAVLGPTQLMIAAAEGLVVVSHIAVSRVVAIERGHKSSTIGTTV